MIVRLVMTEADLTVCLALRRKVFMEEQGVSEAEELDGHDAEALHLLAERAGRPLGTLRLRLLPPVGKIERVCVLEEARGAGVGHALMVEAMAHLRADKAITTARLGAQVNALGFYERLGFTAEGPEFMDAGIPHREMSAPV